MIQEVCDEYYGEHEDLEVKQAVSYLKKKLANKDIADIDYSEKAKLNAYLYRRGFSSNVLKKAHDIVFKQISEY